MSHLYRASLFYFLECLDDFYFFSAFITARSSSPEVFSSKGVLKICSKLTGKDPCRSGILIICKATLLKPHFGMGVLLLVCCLFLEYLFSRTSLEGYFWTFLVMSDPCNMQSKILPRPRFCTMLLNKLLNFSANCWLLVIVLLFSFNIIDFLWKDLFWKERN